MIKTWQNNTTFINFDIQMQHFFTFPNPDTFVSSTSSNKQSRRRPRHRFYFIFMPFKRSIALKFCKRQTFFRFFAAFIKLLIIEINLEISFQLLKFYYRTTHVAFSGINKIRKQE